MTHEILAALRAPFHPDQISWRVGSTMPDKTKGLALGYIDARDAMQRLDDVMGVDWQCRYVPMPNGTCCCEISLFIDGQWRTRSNGAVNIADSEKIDAREMAEKASYSDAFKRAAVLWGIGQYLYDLENIWVELEAKGRSHVIKDSEKGKLRAALLRASGPPAIRPELMLPPPPYTDPKTTALAKRDVAAPPEDKPMAEPNEMDSEAVHKLILMALSFCEDRGSFEAWSTANGRASDKWPLLRTSHRALIEAAAKKKWGEITKRAVA